MTVSRKTAFVAEGQSTGTAAGFSTYAQHIGVGVDVYGNTVGVHGKGGSVGVHGEGEQTGVMGRGKVGFHAVGGTGTRYGVLADGNPDIGAHVSGTKAGTWSFGPLGVVGQSDKEAGVFGQGVRSPEAAGVVGLGSPGGRFAAPNKTAQLNLYPRVEINPGSSTPATPKQINPPPRELPSKGKLGDLWLATHEAAYECSLWLCVHPNKASSRARWAQVLLGTPIEGQAKPAPPLHAANPETDGGG